MHGFVLGQFSRPKKIHCAMPSSLCAQRVARKATPCARGTPGQFGAFGACHAPDARGILGGLWPVRTSPVHI
jgi:hypothetical protein